MKRRPTIDSAVVKGGKGKVFMCKVIGVVGSRRRNSFKDYKALNEVFDNIYEKGDRLVSGGCPQGGDRFAEGVARSRGLTITIHHADWKGLGKTAGFERNTYIAEDCDVLLAVVASDRKGGTEDTIKKAHTLGKTVILIQ